jgi:hypothetical protein
MIKKFRGAEDFGAADHPGQPPGRPSAHECRPHAAVLLTAIARLQEAAAGYRAGVEDVLADAAELAAVAFACSLIRPDSAVGPKPGMCSASVAPG